MTPGVAAMDGGTAEPELDPRPLRPEDFPAAFRGAEKLADSSQRRAMRWTALQLVLLVAAAVCSALPSLFPDISDGAERFLGGFLSFVAFTVAFGIALLLASDRTFDNWHGARSIAETIKALAWTYAVCADPFGRDLADEDADRIFQERLGEAMTHADGVGLSGGGQGAQISASMRQVRTLDLAARRSIYTAGRIDEQQRWYDTKSEFNRRRAARWFLVGLAANVVGIVGAALRGIGVLDADLLGIFATLATAVTAWIQARQYRVLASSYAGVSQGLSTLGIGLPYLDTEAEWRTFVKRAESMIAQEHTLWLARRGVVI